MLTLRTLPLASQVLPQLLAAWIVFITTAALRFIRQRQQIDRMIRSKPRTTCNKSGRNKWLLILLVLNVLGVIFVMDFLYRPFLLDLDSNVAFSRMGFVDDTSAKVLIRAPYITDVRLDYRMDDSSGWKTGEVQSLSKDNDYTATYRLLGLGPDTQYHYRTNTSHSGTFRTAPVNPKSWSIIASSCIKPGFPYDPVGHPLRIRGLEHLSRYIQTRRTEFMLFLGDFIYVDLPLNLGQKKEDYRRAYRQVYASPSWSESLWSLPFLHTYDNHEFENDWAGYTSGIFDDAVEPFNTYQGQANPDSAVAGHAYFTFNKGDVSFFVLDTRRYRDPQSVPDGAHKTMLGANQFEALLSWIQATKGIKVVVSSVPFTNNWRGPEAYDSWAGYQYERQVILSHMWANNGGIIISGVSLVNFQTNSNAKDLAGSSRACYN